MIGALVYNSSCAPLFQYLEGEVESHISQCTRLLDGNSGSSVVSDEGEARRSDTGESILSDFLMLLPAKQERLSAS